MSKVQTAVYNAEQAAVDIFLRTLEDYVRRGEVSWGELHTAIDVHLPFGIEIDNALAEYFED